MRIAFIAGVFPKLSKHCILDQITGLIDRGHEVDIYAEKLDNGPLVHSDVEKYSLSNHVFYWQGPNNCFLRALMEIWLIGINFYKNPILLMRSLLLFKRGYRQTFALLLRSKNRSYDIIHCQYGELGPIAMLLREAGFLKGRLIVSFGGYDITGYIHKYGKHAYGRLFKMGDFFLPDSEHCKSRLIDLGCDKKKIAVYYLGIDCNTFSFTRRQLKSKDCVRIISVSRLIEKKGIEYAVRAVARLSKTCHNIEYNIVGDGPLKAKLQRLIRELGVYETVKLHGAKNHGELARILDDADILLSPSITARNGDEEGIPLVLKEAMAMGLPVIGTCHGGIPELVKDGIRGFLVPERDVDALVEKLSYLISHPELCSDMGRSGSKFVKEHHDIDRLNGQLVDIYNQVMTRTQKNVS